jgi:hypothetical protein
VVTNEQLLLMIGIPMVFNAAPFGIVIAFFEVKFGALGSRFGGAVGAPRRAALDSGPRFS